jgi:membrane protein
MFFVVKGAVALSRNGQVFRTMRAGEYFGEMAMLRDAPRTATATVSEPETLLVRISHANMTTVFREDPNILLALLREMAERLERTNVALASG